MTEHHFHLFKPSHIKLTYFPIRGLGEDIRLLFEESGTPYENETITFHDWSEGGVKQQRLAHNPFGQMPILYWGDFVLSQSKAICRFVAKHVGLDGHNAESAARADQLVEGSNDLRRLYTTFVYDKEYASKKENFLTVVLPRHLACFEAVYKAAGTKFLLSNDKPCYADIILFELLDQIETVDESVKTTYAQYPHVVALKDSVASRPNIAAYINSERRTKYCNASSAGSSAFRA